MNQKNEEVDEEEGPKGRQTTNFFEMTARVEPADVKAMKNHSRSSLVSGIGPG